MSLGSEKLREPRYARKATHGFSFWGCLLVVLVVFITAYTLLQSPYFNVGEIEVKGNHRVGSDEVISLSGLLTGENIFKLDLKEAEGRIGSLPLIKTVKIKRELPSRILITVVERKPLVLIPVDSRYILVDEEGVCLYEGDVADAEIPIITGFSLPRTPLPGEVVRGKNLLTGLSVVKELPEQLASGLSEVNVSGLGRQVVLYTIDGVQCRLGQPEQVAEKGDLLLQVMNKLKRENKNILYIDLSVVGRPVVKYCDG